MKRAKNPPDTLRCSRCEAVVTPGRGEFYLVDVRAAADPSPPVFVGEDFSIDAEREIERLLKRLRRLSPEELAAQVFARRLFCLCNACYAEWSLDPFGAGRKT